MAKSELFASLNDVEFAEKSPVVIEREIISAYEAYTGRSLAKGDPVRLFLESIALIIIQQRNLIDYAAKQNLLAYASGDFLDHIGALLGVTRLEASKAVCTLRFNLSAELKSAVIIPSGTRVTPDGNIIFATLNDVEIKAGDLEIEVGAECESSGIIGNDFLAGQINKLVDVFAYEMSVVNITDSTGGAETESDENFRERINIAPESFSSAGPFGAYEYLTRSAHQDIIDVAVLGQPYAEPGTVKIYPLLKNGELPGQEILELVLETCSARDKRPLTDEVLVLPPESVSYEVHAKFYIDRANASQASLIKSRVEAAYEDFKIWQKNRLGRDINPSELNFRLVNAGAKRVEIYAPEFKVLKPWEVAIIDEQGSELIYGGLEDG